VEAPRLEPSPPEPPEQPEPPAAEPPAAEPPAAEPPQRLEPVGPADPGPTEAAAAGPPGPATTQAPAGRPVDADQPDPAEPPGEERPADRPGVAAAEPPPAPAGQPAVKAPGAPEPRRRPLKAYGVPVRLPARPTQTPDDAENPDLRTDQLLARPRGGPQQGWQATVYRLSGGRLRLPPGRAELAQYELEARVTTPVEDCRRIAVIALKGGVGKTTTTACLGATFAQYRGDRVVALDANPDPGTLGYRIRRDTMRTVKDLLADVGKLERYADVRAYASQTDLRLEVIASEVDPGRSEAFDEDDYRELAGVLERFYSLVLTDCGPGLLHSAMRAVLSTNDQLVVVSAPSLDGARSASLTLDWLERHGRERLVASSVVVINAVRERGMVDVDRLEDHFARRCRAVVRVPFDRHLETGAEIVLDELAPATRRAYVRVAAAVAEGFGGPRREQDQP
jgi:MinD-like ATPase involved in chromosome partitioning or flagellar assembly